MGSASTNQVAYVEHLYRRYLGRASDKPGYDGWLAALRAGMPRADVRDAFFLV